MRRGSIIPAAVALALPASLLAACGSPEPQPAPSPTATVPTGQAATVAALPPRQRAGVLLRAIRDAGQDCQQVVDQASTRAPGRPPVWVATCQDRHRWVVAIAADGTATVTDADDLAKGR